MFFPPCIPQLLTLEIKLIINSAERRSRSEHVKYNALNHPRLTKDNEILNIADLNDAVKSIMLSRIHDITQ
jgi:hypothetical protein